MFEPNTETTWQRVRVCVETFLNQIWLAGWACRSTPQEAYRVRVGLGVTMTEADIDRGLLTEIAVAPVKPAAFIIFLLRRRVPE